jgi:phosphoribosylanthranilate isomerase
MRPIEFLPAVDIRAGQVIQTGSGGENYSGTPKQVIDSFIASGCKWIHLVDLDAAYSNGENYELINHLISNIKVDVQLSGGIANQVSLEKALATKARWINLATTALVDLDWVVSIIKKNADRVCISLDVSNDLLVARGSGVVVGDLWEYLKKLDAAGCNRYVVTDNQSDGNLSGPNIALLAAVQKRSLASIISSGGVSTISELTKLRQMGIDGVVVGKALYTGALDLTSALSACYK